VLRTIELENFQNHRATKLDLSPGVNVIVGPSRGGKTAVLRALRWLVENRPSGDEFRRHGAEGEKTSVAVETSEGHFVWRSRGPTANHYCLDQETFTGFGQDVPAPVAEALNLGDLNVQHQFDTPFLLFDSPGQVARYLNRVVSLDVIDAALANAAAMKRRNDRDMAGQADRAAELEALRDSFPDLVAAEEFVEYLEGLDRDLADRRRREVLLDQVRIQLSNLRPRLERSVAVASYGPRADALAGTLARKELLEYTRDLLEDIGTKLVRLWHEKNEADRVASYGPRVEGLARKAAALAKSRKALALTARMQDAIFQANANLAFHRAEAERLQSEYDRLMPERCPLCGR